jgi:hypothetical protein
MYGGHMHAWQALSPTVPPGPSLCLTAVAAFSIMRKLNTEFPEEAVQLGGNW